MGYHSKLYILETCPFKGVKKLRLVSTYYTTYLAEAPSVFHLKAF